jgi:hypothetical protein
VTIKVTTEAGWISFKLGCNLPVGGFCDPLGQSGK